MLRVAWANLRAHPIRLFATALSVVLGVAFVVGTFVFSDTIRTVFDDLFGQAGEVIDVAVRPVTEFDAAFGMGTADVGVDEDVIPAIEAVEGVAAVEATYQGVAQLLDSEGNLVGGQGPPTIGSDVPTVPAFDNQQIEEGRYPESADEIAIDADTADQMGAEVGVTIAVVVDGPAQEYTLTGIFSVEGVSSLAGATLTQFDDDTARDLYGSAGATEVYVQAEDGVDRQELRDQIAAVIGENHEAVTGETLTEEASAGIGELLGFLTTGLLIFAGVSLLVGAVIIFNTFTIIIAQRTRELALVRAVGAGRGQVLASVLAEALAVGLIGSVVGLGFGMVVAFGLRAVLDVIGVSIPGAGLVIAPRTVLVAVVLGAVVTVVSAVAPALRATRVPPVEAMRALAAPPPARPGRIRPVLGALILVAGIATLSVGLFADGGLPAIAAGAVLVLFGVAGLSPLVTTPVARLLGTPIAAARGMPGALARENAMRNPRRTASTAAALMIGLGLVSFTLIFAASLQASVDRVLEERFLADYQVQPTNFVSFPEGVSEALTAVDGVEQVSSFKFGTVGVEGVARTALAVDPDVIGDLLAIEFTSGDLDALGEGRVVLADDLFSDLGVALGDTIDVRLHPTGSVEPYTVIGTYNPSSVGQAAGQVLIDRDLYAAALPSQPDAGAFVSLREGVGPDQARPRLEAALAAYPTARLLNLDEIREQVAAQTNQLLGLVFALLLLSVIIALIGIVNTLGLSVVERTRELGLLRAVGMERAQTRTMVRWEAVIIAVLGSLLGLVVGTLFGWLGVRALAGAGFEVFSLPAGQMMLAVVVAGLAGVLAAVLPARRASRVDVLRALQVE